MIQPVGRQAGKQKHPWNAPPQTSELKYFLSVIAAVFVVAVFKRSHWIICGAKRVLAKIA